MTAQTHPTSQTLYEQDYALWLKATIEQLRQGNFSLVDLENLIEELESMGRSDRRALTSLLTRLEEHLLKLAYWESEREYNRRGWESEIANFRIQIKNLLEDSPSLKSHLEKVFEKAYGDAREVVIKATGLTPKIFPVEPIASLEQVLDKDWFPSTEN
jgi:septal ring factor EnvC (AmiA/AmiB activator)